MKHYLHPVFALLAFSLLAVTTVQAETEKKIIIALKTHDFELTETDISTLAIGEGQTIETESGKVIDILRTVDGAEIYVDGELLDMNLNGEGLHAEHMIKKHVEIICDDDEECNKNIVIIADGNSDHNGWETEDGDKVFIHKEIEISCTSDEEGTNCSDEMVWISDGEDFDLEELHEMHKDGEGHRVIMIKKEVSTED